MSKVLATKCQHTDRWMHARGLCASCYNKWLMDHNPRFKTNNRKLKRQWYASNPQKEKDRIEAWHSSHPGYLIKKKYGLSIEQLNAIIQVQDDKCPICQTPLATVGQQCIDHDHVTGFNRGVLCHNCNIGLGMFRDSIDSLLRAVRYLQFPPCHLVTGSEAGTHGL